MNSKIRKYEYKLKHATREVDMELYRHKLNKYNVMAGGSRAGLSKSGKSHKVKRLQTGGVSIDKRAEIAEMEKIYQEEVARWRRYQLRADTQNMRVNQLVDWIHSTVDNSITNGETVKRRTGRINKDDPNVLTRLDEESRARRRPKEPTFMESLFGYPSRAEKDIAKRVSPLREEAQKIMGTKPSRKRQDYESESQEPFYGPETESESRGEGQNEPGDDYEEGQEGENESGSEGEFEGEPYGEGEEGPGGENPQRGGKYHRKRKHSRSNGRNHRSSHHKY